MISNCKSLFSHSKNLFWFWKYLIRSRNQSCHKILFFFISRDKTWNFVIIIYKLFAMRRIRLKQNTRLDIRLVMFMCEKKSRISISIQDKKSLKRARFWFNSIVLFFLMNSNSNLNFSNVLHFFLIILRFLRNFVFFLNFFSVVRQS